MSITVHCVVIALICKQFILRWFSTVIFHMCTDVLSEAMYCWQQNVYPYENIECNLHAVCNYMHAALLKWLQNECRTVTQCCTHGEHKQFESNKASGCFALKLHVCSMKASPCCWFAFIMHVCSLLSYNNIVMVLFAGDLHACGLYSYDSSSLGLFGLQTTHM